MISISELAVVNGLFNRMFATAFAFYKLSKMYQKKVFENLLAHRSEVIIYVVERQANGSSRRILATELYSVLFQASMKVDPFCLMAVRNLNANGFIFIKCFAATGDVMRRK